MLSYYICHIYVFIGLGRAYRLGENLKLSYGRGEQSKKGWDHFYGESWPLKVPCKDFTLATAGGLGWMEWLKMGQGKVHVSCNYSCTIYFLVKILLVKLK